MKVLNNILGYDLKIYQDNDYFCFSIDSVILANLCNINLRTKNICELGTGNGVVPLILTRRTNALIDGVEIQKDLCLLANESILLNNKEKQINIINQDMRDFSKTNLNKYDLVLCNPPYFKIDPNSTKNNDNHKSIARHEIDLTLDDCFKTASLILKEGKRFVTVNRCDRLIDVIDTMKKYKLEPKYLRFIYDNLNTFPNLFIIEGILNGSSGLIVDKPFVMYDLNHLETEEYKLMVGDNNAK